MTLDENWEIGPSGFFLKGTSGKGILLLHGFTASAAEMRLLGEFLHQRGDTVSAPLLPGHGTTPEDLKERTYEDFIAAATEAYQALASSEGIKEVYIIGQSMGGLLALYLAEQGLGSKIVALAAPVWIHQKLGEYSKFIHFFKPFAHRRKKKFRINGKLVYPGYSRMPLKSLASTLTLRKLVLKDLAKIKQPLLLIYSDSEHTVKSESADYIEARAIHSKVTQLRLDNSGHTITLDRQKEIAFQGIADFFEEKKEKS